MQSNRSIDWLMDNVDKGTGELDLGCFLTTKIARRLNGVSIINANFASREFSKRYEQEIKFEPITNGIDLKRWMIPELSSLLLEEGIINQFQLPEQNFEQKIDALDDQNLRVIKRRSKEKLINGLVGKIDQYGNPINIPAHATLGAWAKRIDGYKRPEMLFEDEDRLAQLLVDKNIHLLLAGIVHPTAEAMQDELQQILQKIDQNPIFKERVHFVVGYDEELAELMLHGCEFWCNIPEVLDKDGNPISTEACGTSWEKALVNLAIIISTKDGGIADQDKGGYLKVHGSNHAEELDSLYRKVKVATNILNSGAKIWGPFIKRQLITYLPTIAGGKMIEKYVNFKYPLEEL